MKNVRNMPGKQKEESSGKYDFIGISKYIATASVLLTLFALGVIIVKGFQYGVDFAGGTEIQVQFTKPVEASEVRKFTADEGFPKASVQAYGSANEYLIRLETAVGKNEKETNEIMKQTI